MASTIPTTPATSYDELLRAVRGVRDRWRVGRALRGLLVWLVAAIVVVAMAALLVARFRFGETALLVVRLHAYAVLVVLLALLVGRALLRRPSDAEVALYVEEHVPGLDAALVSAVEHGRAAHAETSPALVRRLVTRTAERTRTLGAHAELGHGAVRWPAVMLAIAAGASALLLAFGPASMRDGARLLFMPWGQARAAAAGLRVEVTPGNATVARGGDQRIVARPSAPVDSVMLVVRRDSTGDWERMPMVRAAEEGWTARVFDIRAPMQYYVEAGAARTPTFTLAVADLPYTERIDLAYRYPAYTGLAPDTVEGGGDVSALRGTVVRVHVRTTRPSSAGQLVVEGRDTVPLVPGADGMLVGDLRVQRAGFYTIRLAGPDGRMAPGSLDYTIDVVDDQAPSVRLAKPGRDTRATALEEVFAEAVAEDDYGVARLDLVYSVNGGPERTVALQNGRPRREVSAGHTFFLEEFQVEPGDVVSYYARATDNDGVSGAKQASTDIYFLTVRPFDQEYRQADQGGGGGGGAPADQPGALSARQRDVVAATFRTLRDRATDGATTFQENVATIVLAQGTVRTRTEELQQQLVARGVIGMDSAFATIARELPLAVAAMREAEAALSRQAAQEALGPEQRALQHLQRAEAAFREVEVSFGGGGGGGGGEGASAEDLADLFELETDKLRNQYETVPNAGQQAAGDRAVDETLERLKELARRQQLANEELERRRQGMQAPSGASGGGGGGAQRQLAQEAEELARRLERLARERSSPELDETSRRLQDAAAAMRNSAAGGQRGQAQSAQALERLEQARQSLDRAQGSRLEQAKRDVMERAERVAREQRAIASEMQRLGGAGMGDSAAARRAEELAARKDTLAREVTGLETQLERLARGARGDQPRAARQLQETAQGIRERRLPDKLRYSRDALRRGAPQVARNLEPQIGREIEAVREQVAGALGALGDSPERRESQALGQTRDLVRGMESLAERTRERAEGGTAGGEQGQEGQAGQQGQGGQGGQGAQPSDGQPGGRTQLGTAGSPGQGGPPSMGTGGLSGEEQRQLRRELRERRGDAEELRRELARQGMDVRALDAELARLRALESSRAFDDPAELAALQGQVVEGLKAFEFALRRALGDQSQDAPTLGRSGEVPAGYRRAVEEYYRGLARRGAP